MDRTQRIALRDNWLAQKDNGMPIAQLFNNHASLLSKDSSFMDTMISECCKINKDPSQIDHVYQQFCQISDPQQKITALSDGFRILAPRYSSIPDYLNTWFVHLTNPMSRDVAWKADQSLRTTFKKLFAQDDIKAVEYLLHSTPVTSRVAMERMLLDLALPQSWSKPDLFASVARQMTSLSSSVKLEMYLKVSPAALEKKMVALTILQSLEPEEQAQLFVDRAYLFVSRNINVGSIVPFWKDMLPFIGDLFQEKLKNKDVHSLLRTTLPAALMISYEHFYNYGAGLEHVEPTRAIMNVVEARHLYPRDVQYLNALNAKIQQLVLNDATHTLGSSPSKRKI